MDAPASPAFNESTTDSKNADSAADNARRGRKSLRVDLGVPDTSSPAGGVGLTIPQ